MKIDTQEASETEAAFDDLNGDVFDEDEEDEEEAQNHNHPTRHYYYFSENRKFKSIVKLVSWYCRNSLKESFQGLDTFLLFPYSELFLAEATFEFKPPHEDSSNMLSLRPGERVAILDQLDGKGWWKAYNGSKIGYIPKTFVVSLN